MRPKRFGKTLMLSTCRYFFDMYESEKNRALFKGLYVEKSSFFKEQGQYPVIFISLKDIKEDSYEKFIQKIMETIGEEFTRHSYLGDSIKLSAGDKQIFKNISERSGKVEQMANSLKYLSKYLSNHHGRKVVILIDEYDTPIIEGELRGYYEKAKDFIAKLLSAGVKDNDNLHIGIMTGIVRMSGAGIFSG